MPKITSITPNGQWQEFYKLDIRFDNGDFGTAFAKSENPSYKVGDEVEYTKNEKGTIKIQRGDRPAWNPSSPKANDDRSASIIRQVALKSAVEMSAAYVSQGATIAPEKIFELAEKFNAWMSGTHGATHQEHFAARVEESSPF